MIPESSEYCTRFFPESLAVALNVWFRCQLSGPHSHDQCGVDQNDQRRHLATERLLQECRKMWGDA